MQTGSATVENSMEVLKKLKIELHYDPAVALLGIYPKDTGVLFQRGTCTPMFIATLSTIAKVWKEPKCPLTDEWIKKWCVYACVYTHARTHSGVLPGNQKEGNFAICNNVDGTRECIMLSKIRERHII